MLRLYKNQVVCDVSRNQVDIRELELDWYTTNYNTMSIQAAMFAGFAFDQVTEPVPEGTDLTVECMYLILTAASLGFSLYVCISCTLNVIFGRGLALRGPDGTKSVHHAVDTLRRQQNWVFLQFFLGLLSYLLSHIFEIWIFFRTHVALIVSIPLSFFFLLIIFYSIRITRQLDVLRREAVTGQIHALKQYEQVSDLDQDLIQRRRDSREHKMSTKQLSFI